MPDPSPGRTPPQHSPAARVPTARHSTPPARDEQTTNGLTRLPGLALIGRLPGVNSPAYSGHKA